MCDFSTSLIAWHDGELLDDQADALEQHVRVCSECRDRLNTYENVSGMVTVYCDVALASKTRGGQPRCAPALGVAASIAVLLIMIVHPRAGRFAPDLPAVTMAVAHAAATVAPAAIPETAHALMKGKIRSHSGVASARAQNAHWEESWLPSEPAIQLAIPGEAIFPPGAFPQGIDFVADVSIAADGSAQRLRLQPRLAGFEGGSNQ